MFTTLMADLCSHLTSLPFILCTCSAQVGLTFVRQAAQVHSGDPSSLPTPLLSSRLAAVLYPRHYPTGRIFFVQQLPSLPLHSFTGLNSLTQTSALFDQVCSCAQVD